MATELARLGVRARAAVKSISTSSSAARDQALLVAADLLRTVAVAPTLDNVYVLGLIVVIRTFLSFSLETEIEGVAPWRRALVGGTRTIRRAAASAPESETPP